MALAAHCCLGVCNNVGLLYRWAVHVDVKYEKQFDHHYLRTSHNHLSLTESVAFEKFGSFFFLIFKSDCLGKKFLLFPDIQQRKFVWRRSWIFRTRYFPPTNLLMRCVEIMVFEMLLVPYICIYSTKMQKSNIATNTKAVICG